MRYSLTPPKSDRAWTARFMVSDADCPHLCTPEMEKFYAGMAKEHSIASGFYRSMRLGEFKTSDDDTRLFFDHDMAAVRAAMKRPASEGRHGTLRAGIDLSTTADGDPKIIYIADGTIVLPAFTLRIDDTMEAGDAIVKILRDHFVEPRNAVFDAGGSGKPIVDYIENRCGYRPAVRYMVSQAPRYREEYYDRATEDHYRLKRLLHTQPMVLPDGDRALYEQMRTRRIKEMDHGKIKLQPKPEHRKEHKESPDRLDAIVMCLEGVPELSTARQHEVFVDAPDPNRPWDKGKHIPDLRTADLRTGASRTFTGIPQIPNQPAGPGRPFSGAFPSAGTSRRGGG